MVPDLFSRLFNVTPCSDLRGSTVAYNDAKSLSGCYVLLDRLLHWADLHNTHPRLPVFSFSNSQFFAKSVCTGGHTKTLELLLSGEVDFGAIDSQLLHKLQLQGIILFFFSLYA